MRLSLIVSALLSLPMLCFDVAAAPRHFDVLIRGGEIVDGSGSPRYRADIAIKGDEIVAIGRFDDAKADRIIDARNKVVTPGFIDMHAHIADAGRSRRASALLSDDRRLRAVQNYVAQGITSAVVNPDGFQNVPLTEQRVALEKLGIGLNAILMNGHTGLRRQVMPADGDVNRAANVEEIRRMQDILRTDLAAGRSFGMSLGLEYHGALNTSLDEQLALGKVLAEYNGVFIPHVRSSGLSAMGYQPSAAKGVKPATLEDSIQETLQVAEQTGATVVFTHMKALGTGYRGQAKRFIQTLQAARDRGARVYMDVYPYDSSSSDGSFVAMPPWIFKGTYRTNNGEWDYRADFDAAWQQADAATKDSFAADVRHQIALKGGAENIRILEFPRADYVGQSYAELMKLRRVDAVQLAILLQREGNPQLAGGARMRSFSMDENDVIAFFKLDWCAVSTDGWMVLPEEAVGDKKYDDTHGRVFGSYPRRLAYFSRDLGIDTLEHAVRAASGLPAEILNIHDRGRIAPGMKADVVVLDLLKLKDNTTYLEPSVYPSGIEHVLINGGFAVDGGERTLALRGKVLSPSSVPSP